MWRLENDTATIKTGRLSAEISLNRPSHGISNLHLRGRLLADAALLRVQAGGFPDQCNEPLADSYVRGSDLFAAYPTNDLRVVQYEMYWRARSAEADGIELTISARTDSLDCDPQIEISNRIPCGEVFRAVGSSEPEWETLERGSSLDLETRSSCGLLLHRLPSSDFSYAVMIHPADFAGGTVSISDDQPSAACSTFRLFDRRLEKGVILRARIQGLFVDRDHDQHAALECYRRFRAAALPLAT